MLSGIFTLDVTWRWCFYINLPIGGVAITAIFFLLHKILDKSKEKVTLADFDFGGILLLLISVVSLLLPVMRWGYLPLE